MNNYNFSIYSDLAIATKPTKDVVILKPQGKCIGIELNDERFHKLYATFLGLIAEQYNEDMEIRKLCKEGMKNE